MVRVITLNIRALAQGGGSGVGVGGFWIPGFRTTTVNEGMAALVSKQLGLLHKTALFYSSKLVSKKPGRRLCWSSAFYVSMKT